MSEKYIPEEVTKNHLAEQPPEREGKDEKEQKLIDMVIELCEGLARDKKASKLSGKFDVQFDIRSELDVIREKLENLGLHIKSENNVNKKIISDRDFADLYIRYGAQNKEGYGLRAYDLEDGSVAYSELQNSRPACFDEIKRMKEKSPAVIAKIKKMGMHIPDFIYDYVGGSYMISGRGDRAIHVRIMNYEAENKPWDKTIADGFISLGYKDVVISNIDMFTGLTPEERKEILGL